MSTEIVTSIVTDQGIVESGTSIGIGDGLEVLDGNLVATGGSSGANPTATAGPSVIDGSAPTFMRSDAAPAVQTATTGQLGLVQPDGTTITIDDGVISAAGSNATEIQGTPVGSGSTNAYGVLMTDAAGTTYYNQNSIYLTFPPPPPTSSISVTSTTSTTATLQYTTDQSSNGVYVAYYNITSPTGYWAIGSASGGSGPDQ